MFYEAVNVWTISMRWSETGSTCHNTNNIEALGSKVESIVVRVSVIESKISDLSVIDDRVDDLSQRLTVVETKCSTQHSKSKNK